MEHRLESLKSSARVFAGVLVAITLACAGSGLLCVEVMENGVYVRKNVRSYEISGARDGATTRAVATIALDDGDLVRIDLEVAYNPTAELASGHWKREGKVNEEGDVHAESLKFLGGQGAAPSVGGRFRLDSFGNPRMRVMLPARVLERPLR